MDVFSVEKGDFDIKAAKMYTKILSKKFVFSFTINLSASLDGYENKDHQCNINYTWNQALIKILFDKTFLLF